MRVKLESASFIFGVFLLRRDAEAADTAKLFRAWCTRNRKVPSWSSTNDLCPSVRQMADLSLNHLSQATSAEQQCGYIKYYEVTPGGRSIL